jgi:hypothetical protein
MEFGRIRGPGDCLDRLAVWTLVESGLVGETPLKLRVALRRETLAIFGSFAHHVYACVPLDADHRATSRVKVCWHPWPVGKVRKEGMCLGTARHDLDRIPTCVEFDKMEPFAVSDLDLQLQIGLICTKLAFLEIE